MTSDLPLKFGPGHGMTCAALFVATLLAGAPAGATPDPVAMTGSALLTLLVFPPDVHSTFDLSPGQYLDSERGYRYLDGVRDATAGKSWCYSKPHPAKPDTMYGAAIDGLKQLPAPQLKRNAAGLIVEIWSKRWPCEARTTRDEEVGLCHAEGRPLGLLGMKTISRRAYRGRNTGPGRS